MGTHQTVTNKLKVASAETFVQSVQSNSAYYIFAAKHTAYPGGDQVIPSPLDNVRSEIDIYNDMLFGKRIKTDDIYMMARRYTWTSDTVYTMYDDTVDLTNEKFYVTVKAGTVYNIYKCLFNNNGAPSTQEPFGQDPSPIEYPQDGYVWKYMYSITDFYMARFGTSTFIPIIPDDVVSSSATQGSIDVINIESQGYGYDNYTSGTFRLSEDIAVDGSVVQYGLDSNSSDRAGHYKNCLMLITNPLSAAYGEYKVIKDYFIDKKGRRVAVLDSPFVNPVIANDTYEIYPNVFIYDLDGTSTETCYARAIISPASGNSISRIEVISAGKGYKNTIAKIKTNSTVNVTTEAQLRAIIPPSGGHGYNIANELFGHYVGISQSFIGNNAPLVANNDYRTIGIIKEPRYANVNVSIKAGTIRGSFIKGEEIYRYKHIRLYGNVEVYANSLIVGTNTNFIDSFRYDDQVIITNDTTNILGKITDIYSNTTLQIDTVPTFTQSNCSIYLIESSRFGTLTNSRTASLDLTDVAATGFDSSHSLLGGSSFCTVDVANTIPYVTVNGRDADEFKAFNQLTSFVGLLTSENAFQEDELIKQDYDNVYPEEELVPSAKFHSIINSETGANDDRIYVSNVSNEFNLGVLRGTNSNAYFSPQYKYKGELIKNSGDIVYIENLAPITRNSGQSETVKIILEF